MPIRIVLATPGLYKGRREIFAPGVDAEITPLGRARCHVVSASLNAIEISGVVHAPTTRARETAKILAYVHEGIKPTEVAALADVNVGGWTGKAVSEISASPEWEAWAANPDTFRFPGGETVGQAGSRALAALLVQAETGGLLVAVIDPALIRAILMSVLNVSFSALTLIDLPSATLTLLHGENAEELRVGGIALRGGYGLIEPRDQGRWPDREAIGETWASGGYSRLFRN